MVQSGTNGTKNGTKSAVETVDGKFRRGKKSKKKEMTRRAKKQSAKKRI